MLFREVRPHDVEALYGLARRLNTLNMPADRDRIEALIQKSHDSFGVDGAPDGEGEFVFVMIDPEQDKIIGSCMIIAQHGTYARPSVYFDVSEEQRYSTTLKTHARHQVLNLRFDYDGPSEIGGLILDPAWRGHPLRLGRLLSFVRFLYVGMHRARFRDEIVAELLPPLRPGGGSDLWDHLGAHFAQMDYHEADRISRENVEFIRALFPKGPHYTSLLPAYVREQIGRVGQPTKPAQRMLEAIGFSWDGSIDPFDGGPTFRVVTDECQPIVATKILSYEGPLEPNTEPEGRALVGFDYDEHEVRFRAAFAEYALTDGGVRLEAKGLEKLGLGPGDEVGFLPMAKTGGLQRLY